MSSLTKPVTGATRVAAFAIFGAFGGFIVASMGNPLPLGSRKQILPAPYRTAKFPNGTALRMAMVHDVLHERYLRHGDAWFARRNIEAEKIIAKAGTEPALSMAYDGTLDAMDDLAVGLARLGQLDQAIDVLQKKMALVSPLPGAPAAATTRPSRERYKLDLEEETDAADLQRIMNAGRIDPFVHNQYSTLANLGTIQLLKVLPGVLHQHPDAATKDKLRGCLAEIEQAVSINPAGHFGREVWQAILIRHLLAGTDHPELIGGYDFIGDKLDARHLQDEAYEPWVYRLNFLTLGDSLSYERRLKTRGSITRTGMDLDWAEIVKPDYPVPMPFDEPTLAIVGMWTLGAGPNPHFALALGRIMDEVGQGQIAWEAYERAVEMQADFWPDESVRADLLRFCRNRQSAIAAKEDPSDPAGWEKRMRDRHDAELAWGTAYQKQYWDYEARRIAAGVPLDREDFYKPFFDSHAPIASAPGLADDVVVTRTSAKGLADTLPCLVIGTGLGMALAVVLPGRKRTKSGVPI